MSHTLRGSAELLGCTDKPLYPSHTAKLLSNQSDRKSAVQAVCYYLCQSHMPAWGITIYTGLPCPSFTVSTSVLTRA